MRIKIGKKHQSKPGQFKDPNTGYVAQPRKKFAIQNSELPTNKVEVKAVKAPSGEDVLEVKVYSTHGDGSLATKAELRLSQYRMASEVLYALEVAGGAAAEHLAEAYGDMLDPDRCALYSKELGIEVLKKLNETYLAKRIST